MKNLALYLLVAFLAIQLACAEDVPSMVIELFRHGARSPSASVDPSWLDHDELTEIGYRQHYILGKALAETYPHLLGEYDASKLWVRSTNYNRTLMSAFSQLSGIFEGKGPKISDAQAVNPDNMLPPFADTDLLQNIAKDLAVSPAALPFQVQAIPIHSVDLATDALLYGGPGSCANSSNWFKQRTNDDNAQNVFATLDSTTKYLNKLGYKIEQMEDYFPLGDALIADHMANKILNKEIVYNDVHYNDIVFAHQWFVNYVYGGADIELQAFSYTLVNQLLDWIDTKANNTNPLDFIMLACHDTTLLRLLGLFNVTYPTCLAANRDSTLKGAAELPFPDCLYPTYASQILLEFYNPEGADAYIKFIYNSKAINICGEKSTCTVAEFKDLALKGVGLTPDQFTQLCALPNTDPNTGEIIKILLITTVILIGIILALFASYVCLRKRMAANRGGGQDTYNRLDVEDQTRRN